MKTWLIKEFAKLTDVSVRTLHHYDQLNLLKPSMRAENDYRLYSETDLVRMQQIIALKFMGFNLKQIKQLLEQQINLHEHFQLQADLLQQKADALLSAKRVLDEVTVKYSADESVPWESIMELVEVYKMSQNLESKWLAEALDADELKQYVKFEQDLKQRFTPEQKAEFEAAWYQIEAQLKTNLHNDPRSAEGIAVGKACMDWLNHVYSKEFYSLRSTVWEKGFKSGKGEDLHGMSPAMVEWLDNAMDAYWRSRVYALLAKITSATDDAILPDWLQLLDEMYGDDQQGIAELYQAALVEPEISTIAKEWLKRQQS